MPNFYMPLSQMTFKISKRNISNVDYNLKVIDFQQFCNEILQPLSHERR